MERQEVVGRAAALLKAIAECGRIPVVVTNQVRSHSISHGIYLGWLR